MRKQIEFLSRSPLTDVPDDLDRLFQTVLDRRIAILISAVCTSLLALIVVYITSARWPFVWIALEIALTAARWRVMTQALAAPGPERLRHRDRLGALSLAWGLVFGGAMFACLMTGNAGLTVIACVLTTTVASVVTSRNAAMPRIALLVILLVGAPFLLGLGLSPIEQSWVGVVVSLPWLASLYVLTMQNHRGLVRLIVAERKAMSLAHTDQLTGLHNRAYFALHSNDVAGGLPRAPYAYLCLDLDGFKQVNDRYGHAAGDALLTQVAERLRRNIRKADVLFRIGGDEFVVFLPGASAADCHNVAQRVIAALSQPFTLPKGECVAIGVSVGSACGESGTDVASDLLKNADSALYRAKDTGRGRHVHAA